MTTFTHEDIHCPTAFELARKEGFREDIDYWLNAVRSSDKGKLPISIVKAIAHVADKPLEAKDYDKFLDMASRSLGIEEFIASILDYSEDSRDVDWANLSRNQVIIALCNARDYKLTANELIIASNNKIFAKGQGRLSDSVINRLLNWNIILSHPHPEQKSITDHTFELSLPFIYMIAHVGNKRGLYHLINAIKLKKVVQMELENSQQPVGQQTTVLTVADEHTEAVQRLQNNPWVMNAFTRILDKSREAQCVEFTKYDALDVLNNIAKNDNYLPVSIEVMKRSWPTSDGPLFWPAYGRRSPVDFLSNIGVVRQHRQGLEVVAYSLTAPAIILLGRMCAGLVKTEPWTVKEQIWYDQGLNVFLIRDLWTKGKFKDLAYRFFSFVEHKLVKSELVEDLKDDPKSLLLLEIFSYGDRGVFKDTIAKVMVEQYFYYPFGNQGQEYDCTPMNFLIDGGFVDVLRTGTDQSGKVFAFSREAQVILNLMKDNIANAEAFKDTPKVTKAAEEDVCIFASTQPSYTKMSDLNYQVFSSLLLNPKVIELLGKLNGNFPHEPEEHKVNRTLLTALHAEYVSFKLTEDWLHNRETFMANVVHIRLENDGALLGQEGAMVNLSVTPEFRVMYEVYKKDGVDGLQELNRILRGLDLDKALGNMHGNANENTPKKENMQTSFHDLLKSKPIGSDEDGFKFMREDVWTMNALLRLSSDRYRHCGTYNSEIMSVLFCIFKAPDLRQTLSYLRNNVTSVTAYGQLSPIDFLIKKHLISEVKREGEEVGYWITNRAIAILSALHKGSPILTKEEKDWDERYLNVYLITQLLAQPRTIEVFNLFIGAETKYYTQAQVDEQLKDSPKWKLLLAIYLSSDKGVNLSYLNQVFETIPDALPFGNPEQPNVSDSAPMNMLIAEGYVEILVDANEGVAETYVFSREAKAVIEKMKASIGVGNRPKPIPTAKDELFQAQETRIRLSFMPEGVTMNLMKLAALHKDLTSFLLVVGEMQHAVSLVDIQLAGIEFNLHKAQAAVDEMDRFCFGG